MEPIVEARVDPMGHVNCATLTSLIGLLLDKGVISRDEMVGLYRETLEAMEITQGAHTEAYRIAKQLYEAIVEG